MRSGSVTVNGLSPDVYENILKGFLKSRFFESWVAIHRGRIAALMSNSLIRNSQTNDTRLVSPSVQVKTLAWTGLSSLLEPNRVMLLGNDQCWITLLIAMAEILPLGFCLSSADPRTPGFPLTYVNPAFEQLTGYRREEVIGNNCRFLQFNPVTKQYLYDTDTHELNFLRESLQMTLPSMHILTNSRKDSSIFRNCLCLKPIFDQHGECRFFMSLQFEIKNTSQGRRLDKLVTTNRNLVSMLPSHFHDVGAGASH